jgi:predicted TPR repeat methyltransferase
VTRSTPASAQRLHDLAGQARIHFDLCWIHDRRGEHRQALDAAEQALRLTLEIGDRFGEAGTITRLGDAHHASGTTDAATDAWRRAVAIDGSQ